jgi:hypothetical protein
MATTITLWLATRLALWHILGTANRWRCSRLLPAVFGVRAQDVWGVRGGAPAQVPKTVPRLYLSPIGTTESDFMNTEPTLHGIADEVLPSG